MDESELLVFQWLEVGIFDNTAEGTTRRREIEDRLAGIGFAGCDVYWLRSLHLRALRRAARADVCRVWADWGVGRVEQLEEVNFVAVPQMSTPNSCLAMSRAVQAAGFPNGQPISESEAAGAWGYISCSGQAYPAAAPSRHHFSCVVIPRVRISLLIELQTGEGQLIVADAGGYTLVSRPMTAKLHGCIADMS